MKQKDLVTIIAAVVFSFIVGFILSNQFLVPAEAKKQSAEVVSPITAEFKLPDNKVFNDNAFNPTELIRIAPNDNDQPFANQ